MLFRGALDVNYSVETRLLYLQTIRFGCCSNGSCCVCMPSSYAKHRWHFSICCSETPSCYLPSLQTGVLDEYVQKTHVALRMSQIMLKDKIDELGMSSLSEQGSQLFMELNQLLDFTPKISIPQDERPGARLSRTGVKVVSSLLRAP